MAGFKFNLEPVLNYRCRLEDRAKEELASSLSQYHREKDILEQVEEALAATDIPVQCGKVDLAQMLMTEHYRCYLEQQRDEQNSRVAEAEKEVAQCRKLLEQKRRERKAVELIKEKRWREYLYQQELLEQKAIDDMASTQYIRNLSEN